MPKNNSFTNSQKKETLISSLASKHKDHLDNLNPTQHYMLVDRIGNFREKLIEGIVEVLLETNGEVDDKDVERIMQNLTAKA
jgi:hypothetical protein